MAVPPLGQTDPAAWRLDSSDHGRHVWHYIGSSHEAVWGDDPRLVKERPQSLEATYALGLPLPAVAGLLDPKGNPHDAASKGACSRTAPALTDGPGYEFYKRLQSPDGHFSGEYGGPSSPFRSRSRADRRQDRSFCYLASSLRCMLPRPRSPKSGGLRSRATSPTSSAPGARTIAAGACT